MFGRRALVGVGAALACLFAAPAVALSGSPMKVTSGARTANVRGPRLKRRDDPFASKQLRAWIAARAGRVTAAVYDIKTGHEYRYDPGYALQTASAVKADILATALYEAQQAHHPLPANEAAAAVPMITESDNDAATDLYNDIGGPGPIAAFDASIGMTHTTQGAPGYWGLTTTTAGDQIKLLKQIMLPGGKLTLSSRRYEYELMRHVTPSQRWGISGGVPSDARIAIKNGWLPDDTGWHVNSIGRVQGDGHNYLIAVFTDRDPSFEYGIDTIQRIAAAEWKASG